MKIFSFVHMLHRFTQKASFLYTNFTKITISEYNASLKPVFVIWSPDVHIISQHRDKIIPAHDKNAILMRPHHLKFPAGDHVWRHRCGRSVILVTTAIVKY